MWGYWHVTCDHILLLVFIPIIYSTVLYTSKYVYIVEHSNVEPARKQREKFWKLHKKNSEDVTILLPLNCTTTLKKIQLMASPQWLRLTPNIFFFILELFHANSSSNDCITNNIYGQTNSTLKYLQCACIGFHFNLEAKRESRFTDEPVRLGVISFLLCNAGIGHICYHKKRSCLKVLRVAVDIAFTSHS